MKTQEEKFWDELSAREEAVKSAQARYAAVSGTSPVEYKRSAALQEALALRTALHELRTLHEDSKTSSVDFERDEALDEFNILKSAHLELRTLYEETVRSLHVAQERYGEIRDDSNASKTELKRLK